MQMKIIFVGAGNLATQLALTFAEKGVEILQVYSHSEENAKLLGEKIKCDFTHLLANVRTDADVYIYALKDAVLYEVQQQIQAPNAWHLHTAGSIPMTIFAKHHSKYGVFYPLQTFSKNKRVDFKNIPICIEASSEGGVGLLREMAQLISEKHYTIDSLQREKLHLAAVFTCNFTNRMYAIAQRILEEHGLPFELMLPLIDETARKVHSLLPCDAQTGPAVRFDKNVIDKHISMLHDEKLGKLYQLISEDIYQANQEK